MKRITKEPWFGPKRIDWGWRVTSWQGGVTTIIFVVLVFGELVLFRSTVTRILVALVLIFAFILIASLTGTRPGGPRSQDWYHSAR